MDNNWKERIKKIGIKQNYFAKKIGVTPQYLSRILSNSEKPSSLLSKEIERCLSQMENF